MLYVLGRKDVRLLGCPTFDLCPQAEQPCMPGPGDTTRGLFGTCRHQLKPGRSVWLQNCRFGVWSSHPPPRTVIWHNEEWSECLQLRFTSCPSLRIASTSRRRATIRGFGRSCSVKNVTRAFLRHFRVKHRDATGVLKWHR